MKKYYFFLIALCITSCINAQIVNIPDANFKTALIASPNNVDADMDGEIQESEALQVVNLYLDYKNISDLSGIEYFTNLQNLSCVGNLLTSLFLNGFPNLQSLDCVGNQISYLDVSSLYSLQLLRCSNNPITSLNVNATLKTLICINNQFASLDTAYFGSLEVLDCSNNLLTSLDVSAMPYLQSLKCQSNQLTSLDVNELSNLTVLWCGNNQLTTLFIKNGSVENTLLFENNPTLQYICADDTQLAQVQNLATQYGYTNCIINSSCTLNNETFEKTEISIYPNPTATVLNISSKDTIELKSISIYNTLGQLLMVIPNAQEIKAVDVSQLTTGNYIIKMNSDKGVLVSKFLKK